MTYISSANLIKNTQVDLINAKLKCVDNIPVNQIHLKNVTDIISLFPHLQLKESRFTDQQREDVVSSFKHRYGLRIFTFSLMVHGGCYIQ